MGYLYIKTFQTTADDIDGDWPANVINLCSLLISLVLILLLQFGLIFNRMHGPLRGPGIPKHWARPWILSSLLLANFGIQILALTLQLPVNCVAFHVYPICVMARNWTFVLFGIHTCLQVFKPSCLLGKIQFMAWIVSCVTIWIVAVGFVFLVLRIQPHYVPHLNIERCSLQLPSVDPIADYIVTYSIIIHYVPLVSIGLLSTISSTEIIGSRRCKFLKRFVQTDRGHHMGWINDQRQSAIIFQLTSSILYIIASVVEVPTLYAVSILLFVTETVILKDVRELALSCICYTCCMYCTRSRVPDNQHECTDKVEQSEHEDQEIPNDNGLTAEENVHLGNRKHADITVASEITVADM